MIPTSQERASLDLLAGLSVLIGKAKQSPRYVVEVDISILESLRKSAEQTLPSYRIER